MSIDSCDKCDKKSVYCFLMGGMVGKEYYNWRLDLCEHHADQFRKSPDPGYQGNEGVINDPDSQPRRDEGAPGASR